ncbi:hypothetical protein FOA52_008748 [Chlamydomonas sp. UWO 241]|nr:hypothetical protein FOA52_008748 [Chlamydomonas sp. UWO 241]
MSFQDLAAGRAAAGSDRGSTSGQQDVRAIEAQVFKLASSLGQLKKLVGALGGPKDTVDHRRRIADTNTAIQELAKSTKSALTQLHTSDNATPKSRKLLQDFAAMLQDYKSTAKLAAERESQSLPLPSPPPRVAVGGGGQSVGDVEEGGGGDDSERAALLQAQAQRARTDAALSNSIQFNDALIEERDAGITVIARQIGEVNEMFQDLAVLINDQGVQVNTIDEHITSTAERVKEGSRHLVQAERSGRSSRNRCLCIWLVAATIVSIIIILISA